MYLTIERKLGTAPAIVLRDGVPTLQTLQQHCAGYIEELAKVASHTREGVTLMLFCNQDPRGTAANLPCCGIDTVICRDIAPLLILGTVVIAAIESDTGCGIAMTSDEVAQFALVQNPAPYKPANVDGIYYTTTAPLLTSRAAGATR